LQFLSFVTEIDKELQLSQNTGQTKHLKAKAVAAVSAGNVPVGVANVDVDEPIRDHVILFAHNDACKNYTVSGKKTPMPHISFCQ